MIIKKYLNRLPENKKNLSTSTVYLKNNMYIFKLFANALSKSDINILLSKDDIGGYYEKNIILPKCITLSNKKYINKQCYIYKILFSLTSKKFNFYLTANKENLDYKMIMSLLSVKKIHKELFKKYSNVKKIIKNIYPLTNKKRKDIKTLSGKILLIEIILKKLTYEKINIKINITQQDKYWLFKIENALNITDKNIITFTNNLYSDLSKIYKTYSNVDFYLPWGYIYNKNKLNFNKLLKNNIITSIKKNIHHKKLNINPKKIELKHSKNKHLDSIFDYKKTHDNYIKGNKNIDQSTDSSEIKNLNPNSITRLDNNNTSCIKSNIITEINNNKEKTDIIKKLTYKEWDFKNKIYKNNWCHLFTKKLLTQKNIISSQDLNEKKDIEYFKKNFKLMFNRKIWQKKQKYGQDLDIDSIIDNYQNTLNNTFDKVYKYKKKTNKNISIIILFDSSLSTESYIKEKQTLDKIKYITRILSFGIDNLVTNFTVSTFHSNTRYDCRYIIIKDFNEKWKEKYHCLTQIHPTGYTRIGPAIRHSISIMKNIKTEKKLILLLSDGNPTDYDEYEGAYGANDIKKTIDEANKNKIILKSLLINNLKNKNFSNIFGYDNYFLISNNKPIHVQLTTILKSIIK